MKEVVNKRVLQKEQTSKAILSASLSVFGDLGYNDSTFTDISKIAKVTNGLIVQRFGSKEALYLQLLNGVIANFPSFENANDLNDCLIEIIKFVKLISNHEGKELSFCKTAFNSYNALPESCKNSIRGLIEDTKFNKILLDNINNEKIKNKDALDVFIRFITNCCELTLKFIKEGNELPAEEVYLQLFRKLDSLDETKFGLSAESSIFENISENSLKSYNIITWYAEIAEDKEPSLFLPKSILRKLGVEENSSPEEVYKFIIENVDTEDAPVVRDAIHRMYLGQYVEFEHRWSTPLGKTAYYRCSGKRTSVKDGVTRFEGIMQNISLFKTLRNRTATRTFFLNSIAQDYEYVGYVHIGPTQDDDFVEDFKSSEFLNKLTENWEHNNNFSDRFNLILSKTLISADHERYTKKNNRQLILDYLKKSNVYKTSFKIRHYGVTYHYEVVFFPDREDDSNITGLICGIRLVNNSTANNQINSEVLDCKDKQIVDMLLSSHEASFLINLKDHTFEISKCSNIFNDRNKYIPDFEAFISSYIKRDVYFEDVDRMLEATSIVEIRAKLETINYFSINYRDISRDEPRNFLMHVYKGENNYAFILLTDISRHYSSANKKISILEDVIREKEQDINRKNGLIENINSHIVDLLGEVVESRRENGIKQAYKFKYLTYIFGNQLRVDYPELGLTPELVSSISEASVLHDIGKMAVPDEILYKNGKLTNDEFEIARAHALKSQMLLEKLRNIYDNAYFQILSSVCKNHHERWNGEGYPSGLKGPEIPIDAQIVGLVDAFHALVSKRPYREAYDYNTALNMIINGECGSFNPIFFESLKKCASHMIDYMENGTANQNKIVNQTILLKNYKMNTTVNSQTLPIIARLAEQMPGGFFVYKKDSRGSLLFFNSVMVKYFNCANREDFMKYTNNSLKGMIHNDDYEKSMSALFNNSEPFEDHLNHIKYRIVCKNGEEKIIEHYEHHSHSESFGDICYAFVQDVTIYEKAMHEINHQFVNPVQAPVTTNSSYSSVKTLEGTRILIVDDNDLSRFMTKDTLEDEGANVTDFSSGKAALEAIEKVKPFDIILVDLVMPEMNGVELTQAIREWEEDKDIRVPIVAVTGELQSDLAKQCVEAGANGCMSKPLVIAELARILILSMKEHSLRMERKLSSTIKKANTDVLTHVKNRTAYAEKIEQISSILRTDPYYEFGIIGADINNLKIANDQFGHDTGDMYIKNCCKLLCDVFYHSPVYRVGGDEFAIILEGDDLRDYKNLVIKLKEENIRRSSITEYEKGRAHLAIGCAIYDPTTDMTIDDVIKRSDEEMYKNKDIEKARVAGSFKY